MENKHIDKEKNKKIRRTCAVSLALLLLFGISGITVYYVSCKGAEGNATPSDAAVVELTPGDAALAGATPLDAAEETTEEVTTEETATEEAASEEVTTEEVTAGADNGTDNNQHAQVSDSQTGNAAASGGTQNNSQNKPQTGNAQSQSNTQNSNTQTENTTQQTTQQTTIQATTEQTGNAGKTWVEDEYGYVWMEDSPGHYEELPKYEVEYHIICRCGQDFGTYGGAERWAEHATAQGLADYYTICRGYDSVPIYVQVGTEQIWIEGQGHYEWVVVNPGHWE